MVIKDKIHTTLKLVRKRCKLIWTIEGFNRMPFYRNHPLFGPTFRLGNPEDSIWQLMMSKQRGEEDKLPSLGFKLCKPEDNGVWDSCKFDITVRSRNGDIKLTVVEDGLGSVLDEGTYDYVKGALEEVYQNEDGEEAPDEDDSIDPKFAKYLPKSDPETDKLLWALFKEPIVVVECDIIYTHQTDKSPAKTQERLVIEDIEQLLENHAFSDVVLRAGGKEFLAHSGILCSRSFKFDVLLQENKFRPMELLNVDVPVPVMKMILAYIYMGEFPERVDEYDCGHLYAVSERYSINHLSEYCATVAKERIRDNPEYRDLHSDDDKFRRFLEMNNMKTVVKKVTPVKLPPVKPSLSPNGISAIPVV